MPDQVFTLEEEQILHEAEFPQFVERVFMNPAFSMPDRSRASLRLQAAWHFYQAFMCLRRAAGLGFNADDLYRACKEGMRKGAAVYGCDWPSKDNLTEAFEECRDGFVYCFFDELASMLEEGRLDQYRGATLPVSQP